MKFELGQVVATKKVAEAMEESLEFGIAVKKALDAYNDCDWGTVCEEDKEINNEAVDSGERIVAAYATYTYKGEIWIITEWDRSVTTILFPDEY